MTHAFEEIRVLEEGMWTYELRGDQTWLDKHLHPGFTEIGRSGQRYNRSDLFPVNIKPFEAVMPLQDFKLLAISEVYALTTYVSAVRHNDLIEYAYRSSTWLKDDDQWQLFYHQGTPSIDPNW